MAGIFVVDGHELVRRGIACVLNAQPDLEVVGEASTGRDAVVRIAATCPDAVVLSAALPDGSGLELCRYLGQHHPGIGCLVLSADDDDDAMFAALLAGAAGYLSESVRATDLTHAVRAVASGRRLPRPPGPRQATAAPRCAHDEDPRFRALNLRERQVLALIADGFTNRQIADRLGLAEKTVKNYVSTLLCKLGFEHRTQAAVFEVERLNERERVSAGRW